MTVYCRLKDLIDERNLTQLKVAQETNLSPTIIGGLYRNPAVRRIDCKTAETLLNYFGLKTLDELYEVRK
jgi:transcriptional regulator with XRE-family HTH domain